MQKKTLYYTVRVEQCFFFISTNVNYVKESNL